MMPTMSFTPARPSAGRCASSEIFSSFSTQLPSTPIEPRSAAPEPQRAADVPAEPVELQARGVAGTDREHDARRAPVLELAGGGLLAVVVGDIDPAVVVVVLAVPALRGGARRPARSELKMPGRPMLPSSWKAPFVTFIAIAPCTSSPKSENSGDCNAKVVPSSVWIAPSVAGNFQSSVINPSLRKSFTFGLTFSLIGMCRSAWSPPRYIGAA